MDTKAFIRKIEDGTDDERFTLWMAEFKNWQKHEDNKIITVLESSDGILHILLIRFLSQVPEEDSIKILVGFMVSANLVVAESARKAFEKNRLITKTVFLIPALKTSHQQILFFTIDQLGLNHVEDALAPLMAMVDPSNEILFLRLLASLRHLAKLDTLPLLLKSVGDKRSEVRLRILLILSALYHAEHKRVRQHILPFLNDESPEVRRAGVWALKNSKHSRSLKIFIAKSLNDESPQVRQEAVQALGVHFKPSLVPHLLRIMVHDQDRYVALRAESVLIERPFHQLTRGLKKSIKSTDEKAAFKAIIMFAATHRGSAEVLHYLTHQCDKHKDEPHKVPFIEAMGSLEHPEAIPFLKKLLKEGMIVSYAASVALARIWRRQGGHFIFEILVQKDLPPVLMQVILKQLTKKSFKPTEQDIEYLVKLLEHANLNVRYLAGQIIGRNQEPSCFKPLVRGLVNETDKSNRASLEEFFIAYLRHQPTLLRQALDFFNERPQELALHLKLLTREKLEAPQVEILLPLLIQWSGPQSAVWPTVVELILFWLARATLSWPFLLSQLKILNDGGVGLLDELLLSIRKAASPLIDQKALEKIKNHFLQLNLPQSTIVTNLFGFDGEYFLPELISIMSTSSDKAEMARANQFIGRYILAGES